MPSGPAAAASSPTISASRCSERCRSTRRCGKRATRGVPVVEADPESESARAIVAIAEAVLASRPAAIRKPLTVLS